MKQPFQIFRFFTVLLLVGLLVNTYAWKELHHLLGHDHSEELECEHHGEATHLHDFSFHGSDCFICQFHYAPLKKSNHSLKAFQQIPVNSTANFVFRSFILRNQLTLPALRGPPFVA